MLTWCIILFFFWLGYGCGNSDDDGTMASLVAIPTILTILYLCAVGFGFKP